MTAKRPNKPKRLSTLPSTLTFNDYSDYEGAPESSDFRALPHRLSTLRLCSSDFGAGRHPHPEALAERSGQPLQKIGRPTPDTPGPPPAMPGPGPPPRRPQKPPDGRTGGGICKLNRHGNGPQRATGNAIRPRKRDGDGAQRHRKAVGRKKNKSW